MNFYTNFHLYKNNILMRGYRDGKPFKEKVAYKPYLFIPSSEKTKYKTLEGSYVDKFEFNSIYEARQFIKDYKDVENFNIYGLSQFQYLYINDTYPGNIVFDPRLINVANIDIEVEMKGGINQEIIENAKDPITVITLRNKGISWVFALPPSHWFGKYYPNRDTEKDVQYFEFRSEAELLEAFLTKFIELNIDVVTGWNVELFDVIYIVNRIRRILGDDEVKKLSPWGMLETKTIEIFDKEIIIQMPVGISVLDMQQLYKKFSHTPQESYKLDYICSEELGEQKLDYSEYDSLNELYYKDWPKYVKYNIHDTLLVERLNDKLKLLELVYTLAYDSKVTYNDTLKTVRPWDIMIHNFMLEKGLVVPQFEEEEFHPYEGGYVKEPIPGGYKWVMSFDVTSEYPSLILQYNMSPETLIPGKMPWDINVDSMLNGILNRPEIRKHFLDKDACVPASGYMFSKKKYGIFTEIVQKVFDDRVKYKKLMIDAKKKFEKTKQKEDEYLISAYNNLQMAKKIQLNSLYGAAANKYFRWFRLEIAESITLSGQMTVKWAEKTVNNYLNKALKTENIDYVIAIDTDSLYVCFNRLVALKFGDKQDDKQAIVDYLDKVSKQIIQPLLEKSFKQMAEYSNAYQQKIFMKREAIADFGLWTAKKRYALNVYDLEDVRFTEPKIKITGLQAVQSSTPGIVRVAIKDCLKIIMTKTEKDIQKYVEEFKTKFMSSKFEEIATPKGVHNLEKYSDKYGIFTKGCPIHVRAALLYNDAIKKAKLDSKYSLIQEGEKIRYAYLKLPNPIKQNVCACINSFPPELGLQEFIDYKEQYNKTFFEPTKKLTDLVGWELEKRNTLDDLFGD